MNSSLPLVAGIVSTVVFACSTFPMLRKAAATRDLASYSLGNIVLANLGNLVHSLYVFTLPPGPIWVLYTFYLLSSGLMLFWYLRFVPSGLHKPAHAALGKMGRSPDARSGPSFLA